MSKKNKASAFKTSTDKSADLLKDIRQNKTLKQVFSIFKAVFYTVCTAGLLFEKQLAKLKIVLFNKTINNLIFIFVLKSIFYILDELIFVDELKENFLILLADYLLLDLITVLSGKLMPLTLNKDSALFQFLNGSLIYILYDISSEIKQPVHKTSTLKLIGNITHFMGFNLFFLDCIEEIDPEARKYIVCGILSLAKLASTFTNTDTFTVIGAIFLPLSSLLFYDNSNINKPITLIFSLALIFGGIFIKTFSELNENSKKDTVFSYLDSNKQDSIFFSILLIFVEHIIAFVAIWSFTNRIFNKGNMLTINSVIPAIITIIIYTSSRLIKEDYLSQFRNRNAALKEEYVFKDFYAYSALVVQDFFNLLSSLTSI